MRLCHVLTCITHFPIILRITSPTPIGRTVPSPLSREVIRFAKIASISRGLINSVHKRRVIAAIAAHTSVTDFLYDFDARIRRNPFASTREGLPEHFVCTDAFHTISPFSVGILSLGHLGLARKPKNPNGLPVHLDVPLWAVPWHHHLKAGHPHHREWNYYGIDYSSGRNNKCNVWYTLMFYFFSKVLAVSST